MHLGKKIATLGVAAALVTGVGIAAVSPAQAVTPRAVGGTTLISFDKKHANIIKLLKVIAPAKFSMSKMTFVVTGADGDVVTNAGGIVIGSQNATNPVVSINVPKKTATVKFRMGASSKVLFTASHFKIIADGPNGTVWKGTLNLTKSPATIRDLNKQLGLTVLKPGDGVGQIRVTITN